MSNHPFSHVKHALQQSGMSSGHTVAVQGIGHSGHVPRLLADLVGEDGYVYAVDEHAGFIDGLKKHCAAFGITHVEPVRADFEAFCGVPIRPGSLDAVTVVHTGWRTRKVERLAKEAFRLLKPSGKFIIVDWTPDSAHPLAPKQFSHKEPREILIRLQSVGFSDLATVRSRSHYWFAVLKKG